MQPFKQYGFKCTKLFIHRRSRSTDLSVRSCLYIQPFKLSLEKANVPNWEVIFTAIRHIVITHMRMCLQSYELILVHL